MLSHARVLELLEYRPDEGVFRWRVNRRPRVKAGDVAGCDNGNGYVVITIDRHRCYAHRLAWFYVHGEWPVEEIDHISGNPSDNRLCNLRLATSGQNKANSGLPRHNTSGFKGVSYDKRDRRWYAYISLSNRKKHLGVFDTPEEAHAVYAEAARRHRGEFARVE